MDSFRIAVIAILVFVILGIAPLLDSGQFIIPFGLLKPTFVVILIIGFFIERKKLKLLDYVAMFWTAGLLVTSKFLFEIFLQGRISDNSLEIYKDFHANATLLTYIALLLWMLLLAWKDKNNWSIVQLVGALGIFSSFLLNELFWLLPLVMLWYLGIYFQKKKGTLHSGLAVFFLFTIVVVWLSAYFFGRDAVLLQL